MELVINSLSVFVFAAMTHLDKVKLFGKPIKVALSKHSVVQMPKEGQPVSSALPSPIIVTAQQLVYNTLGFFLLEKNFINSVSHDFCYCNYHLL